VAARFPHPLPSLATVPTIANVYAQLHDPSRPFPCPKCSCRFTSTSSLGGHLVKHRATDSTPLVVSSAHQSSPTESFAGPATTPSSVAPSSSSAAGRPFLCAKCGYTSKKSTHLQRHLKVRGFIRAWRVYAIYNSHQDDVARH
jgi:hypothetical protein